MSNVSGTADQPARTKGPALVFVAIALLVQLVVIWFTVTMGLGWGGWTYIAAVLQSLAGITIILWLMRQRPVLSLAVPGVSALLTAGLLLLGTTLAKVTECSPAERAAVAELAAPPGASIVLQGELSNGCIARFNTSLSASELTAHYEREFAAHGWQLRPGEISEEVVATRNGIVMRIDHVDDHEGLVIVIVDEV